MKNKICGTLFLCLSLCFPMTPATVFGANADRNNPVPIPAAEQALPTENAADWFTVSPENNILEGAIFDAKGNLLFCDVSERKVKSLSQDKKLSTLLELPELGAGGLALHKDGRLFLAVLDLTKGKGGIMAWSPKTARLETIVPVEAGYWPNDLVFAPDGGLYFSDFRGNTSNAAGGVYYVSPDFSTVSPVVKNLVQANGVALDPDGKTLWISEFGKNMLHRVTLDNPTVISAIGSAVPYHFIGSAPDSMRVDSQGNVYVAIYGQGRVMIFNKTGIPVGQILLPQREDGLNLLSTSLAINPDSNELFIVSSNSDKNQKAAIFSAKSLAPGQAPLQKQ